MDFYREGQILSYTAGQALNLSNAQYKHKGVVLFGSGGNVGLKFFNGLTVSAGLTITDDAPTSTGAFANAIIPGRVAVLNPLGNGKILLLD